LFEEIIYLRTKTVFLCLLFLIFVFGSFLLYWAFFIQDANNVIAIVSGVILATIGWATGFYLTLRNHVKQHTMNILIQIRESPLVQEHAQNVLRKFPIGKNMRPLDLIPLKRGMKNRRPWDKPVWESIRYVANYYEFLAVGVHHGDLDERMLKDSLQRVLSGFCEKTAPFIEHARRRDARKEKINKNNVSTYFHLVALNSKWNNKQ
jgi:hypothetical protein